MSLMVVEKEAGMKPLPTVTYQVFMPISGVHGLLGLLNFTPDTCTPEQQAILFRTLLEQIEPEDMGHA